MKRFISAVALLMSAGPALAANPMDNVKDFGEYAEVPGYILKCPTEKGDYNYWFAARPGNGQVAISRLGFPDGHQLFARVVDGVENPSGYNLLLQTEQGRNFYVQFNNRRGSLTFGGNRIECSVSKTQFVI